MTLYALLIGINHYFPANHPDGVKIRQLNGCVRDVNQFESFLKTRYRVPPSNILKLTASHGGNNGPAEDPALWPTYENIVAAFHRITELANPGEQVLIYYSGHGRQAKTIYPDVKSEGIDEGLMPTNIGSEQGRYLRDLELAYLLNRMVDKELVVSVILDACNSGGMTRGDAVSRGSEGIDAINRPRDTLAAPDTESLTATWRTLMAHADATPALIGGIPASDRWVVLTACRAHESANEYPADNVNVSGALTYWFLNVLQSSNHPLSFHQVHQRVHAQVRSKFQFQNPQLYGNGSRAVFGQDHLPAPFALTVIKANPGTGLVKLNGGVEQGIRNGAQFAIFPLDAVDITDFDQALAQVTITTEGVTISEGEVNDLAEGATIQLGAPAVLYHPGEIQLRSRVRLQSEGEGALSADVRKALEEAHQNNRIRDFLQWSEPNDDSDFIVAANGSGEFEIWDSAGKLIPRITPPLLLNDTDAPRKLVARLIHLTRYRNVQKLANGDSRAEEVPNIEFKWLDVAADHTFVAGETARLFIQNNSPSANVEITVLDLAPDWSIRQIYPQQAAASYTFALQESDTLTFDVLVGGQADQESSFFKLFATLNPTNFRLLELPALDGSERRSVPEPANELEELLSQVAAVNPTSATRTLTRSITSGWTTAQVELRVRRQ